MQDWHQECFIIVIQCNRMFHNPTFHWKAAQYNRNVEKGTLCPWFGHGLSRTFYNQIYQLLLNYSSPAATHCESFETSDCSQKIQCLWEPSLKGRTNLFSFSFPNFTKKNDINLNNSYHNYLYCVSHTGKVMQLCNYFSGRLLKALC